MNNYKIKSLFVILPFVILSDSLRGRPQEVLQISKTGKDKTALMAAFNRIRDIERATQERRQPPPLRFEISQKLTDKSFLSYQGYPKKLYYLETLEPKNVVDDEVLKVRAVLTDKTYSYNTVSGAKKTIRVMQEVKIKQEDLVIKELTQDEFVKRLKRGETWRLPKFIPKKCSRCVGKGRIIGQNSRCGVCGGRGGVYLDCIVKW